MKEYWIGIDLRKDDACICTTKSGLSKFFCVSTKTIDRWISAGNCSKDRLIYRKHINKVKNTWSKLIIK